MNCSTFWTRALLSITTSYLWKIAKIQFISAFSSMVISREMSIFFHHKKVQTKIFNDCYSQPRKLLWTPMLSDKNTVIIYSNQLVSNKYLSHHSSFTWHLVDGCLLQKLKSQIKYYCCTYNCCQFNIENQNCI